MNVVKERPILFSGPMVRAILEGRKTVTRRPVKPAWPTQVENPMSYAGHRDTWMPPLPQNDQEPWYEQTRTCPYGKPGDRLWVRETFAVYGDRKLAAIHYRADHPEHVGRKGMGYKPSIHMPRWVSRILLEITDVRVERLQHISDEQALTEGIIPHVRGGWHWHRHDPSNVDDWHQFGFKTPFWAFRDLWLGINGQESWDTNPWVWVVEFKRVMP